MLQYLIIINITVDNISQENHTQLNFMFSFCSLYYSTNGNEKYKKKKNSSSLSIRPCKEIKFAENVPIPKTESSSLFMQLNVSLHQRK